MKLKQRNQKLKPHLNNMVLLKTLHPDYVAEIEETCSGGTCSV